MSDQPIEPPATQQPQQPRQPRSAWQKLLVLVVVLVSAGVGMAGTLLLLNGGSADPGDDVRACFIDPASRDFTKDGKQQEPKCPPKGADMLDGLVEKTSDSGFTIRVIEDGKLGGARELHVRAPDRAYIDIAHAQTHAALGQPVRVYLEEIDGRDSVVYMEDAPLLG